MQNDKTKTVKKPQKVKLPKPSKAGQVFRTQKNKDRRAQRHTARMALGSVSKEIKKDWHNSWKGQMSLREYAREHPLGGRWFDNKRLQ